VVKYTYMDTTIYKELLTTEKANLERELLTIARKNPSNPNDWEPLPEDTGLESDESDRADLIEDFGNNTAIVKDLEIRFNEVLQALERINAGTYGICTVSGMPIEKKRLDANPSATTCIAHM